MVVRRTSSILGLGVVLFALAGALSQAQVETPDYHIAYSGSPDAVVIEYDVESAIKKIDDTPLMRIYGDGRVHVHRQPYREGAGDYEMHLTEKQLADLLQLMHDNGALSFDTKSVAQDLRASKAARANSARSGRAVLTERSDVEVTIIRVNLDAYQASTNSARQSRVQKEIRCVDLRNNADEHPQVTALTDLADVEGSLKAMAHDARLRAVGGAR